MDRVRRYALGPGRTLGWLLLVCVPCALIGQRWAQQDQASRRSQALSQEVASFSGAMNSLLTQHEALPRLLSLDGRLVAALAHAPSAEQLRAANDYLKRVAEVSGIAAAYCVDTQGTAVVASNWNAPSSFVGRNFAFRPYFQSALKSGTGHFYGIGSVSGEPGYFLASRLLRDDTPLGVVVVKIDLRATVKPASPGPVGAIGVADEEGVVFLASDPALLYRTLRPLRPEQREALQQTRKYGAEALSTIDDDPAAPRRARWMRTPAASHRLLESPIPGTPWSAFAIGDAGAEEAAQWTGLGTGLLVGALLFAAACVVQLRRQRKQEAARASEALRVSEARLRAVADHLPVMVCLIDLSLRYVYANDQYAQMYGMTSATIEQKHVREVLPADDYDAVEPQLLRALAGEDVVFEREYRHLRGYRCFEATYRPEWDSRRRRVTGVHAMTQEVTETKQRLAELNQLAQLDHLTQLLNRKGFESRLQAAIDGTADSDKWIALLYIDLDGFKLVNDSHGHPAGDELLCAFSQRLVRLVRAADAVGRLGGDEFAVLLANLTDVAVAHRLAHSIVEKARTPFNVANSTVSIGASVGVAVGRLAEGVTMRSIAEDADRLLYRAKRSGKNQFSTSR